MRLLQLIIVIGGLWAFDTYALQGRYQRVAWEQANYHGQKFYYDVRYWLRRSGL
jgi:hypothetical protein